MKFIIPVFFKKATFQASRIVGLNSAPRAFDNGLFFVPLMFVIYNNKNKDKESKDGFLPVFRFLRSCDSNNVNFPVLT